MTGYLPQKPTVGGSDPSAAAKAYFLVTSVDTITLNTDPANPSFITGITESAPSVGFEIADAATGAIRNITGRTLQVVSGTVSYLPNKDGGGTTLFNLVSERSSDNGVTWTGNLLSSRPIEISNTGESFGTKVSSATNWAPDELIRFRAYAISGGELDFKSSSRTVLGQTFVAPSFEWQLDEL